MIEESARVIKVEADVVWVQAIQQSACGSCQAQKGCGHSLLAKVGQKQIELPVDRNGLDVQENDQVMIGVPEQAVLRSSLLMYGLPLGAMIVVSVLASLMGASEPVIILAAFISLLMGFVYVARFARQLAVKNWQPRLMRKISTQQSQIPLCEVEH